MEYVFTDLNQEQIQNIVGVNDENLNLLEELYGCGIVYRGNCFKLLSDDEDISMKFIRHMDQIVRESRNGNVDYDFIKQSFLSLNTLENNDFHSQIIAYSSNGKPFRCKTANQYELVNQVRNNDLVFCIGPAGTGKTYLSVAMAVRAFRAHEINRIILTRPAVEAGEKLGFLPGDLQNKVDPYLRPLYDALFDMLGAENYQRYLERGNIEVAPLAYMRGRTLDDSFIILDEAQNTTSEQMKMLLTRIGASSRAVITGDITQTDLPADKKSGLVEAIKILKDIKDIEIVTLSDKDIVRHRLVQEIVKAYERYYEGGKKNR